MPEIRKSEMCRNLAQHINVKNALESFSQVYIFRVFVSDANFNFICCVPNRRTFWTTPIWDEINKDILCGKFESLKEAITCVARRQGKTSCPENTLEVLEGLAEMRQVALPAFSIRKI